MATVLSARIVDGDHELILTPSDSIDVEEIDFGLPEVRAIQDPRTQADGTRDRSAYHGAAPVTISGRVWGNNIETPGNVLDELRGFLHPRIRPWLIYQIDGQDERRIRLRADNHNAIMTGEADGLIKYAVSWLAPDGVSESVDQTTVIATATADIEAGRSYDLTFDRVYPSAAPIGTVEVNNPGNVQVWPTLRIYGPCTQPRIENQTNGGQLIFREPFGIAAGSFVEVDMRERTVLLNGLPSSSRYNQVDFAASDWWPLDRGDNTLRLFPADFSGGAQAQIIYRAAWI